MWRHRLKAALRRDPVCWALIGVGLLLVVGAGTAATVIAFSYQAAFAGLPLRDI